RVQSHPFPTAVDPGLPRRSEVDGMPVSRVAINADSLLSKITAAAPMLIEVGELMRNTDVVHAHGYSQKNLPVTAFAKVLRVPVVLSLHTAGSDEPAAIRRQGALARWALETV